MKRWEYKTWTQPTINQHSEDTMNELGNDGWEIVSVVDNVSSPRFPNGAIVWFLKREKQDNTAYRGNV